MPNSLNLYVTQVQYNALQNELEDLRLRFECLQQEFAYHVRTKIGNPGLDGEPTHGDK